MQASVANHEIEAFIKKWRRAELKERSASQEHFIDLCRLLGERTPAEADPKGEWYCFEAGASKLGGGDGFADVWMRDHFAWEYKGKKKNLNAAYLQLCQYREDLGNPPLLVVCDTDRFEIHTNFTATVKKIYSFRLQDLRDGSSVRVLENLFREPQKLRPSDTPESVTIDAAARIAQIAISLERRGISPERAAHFLVQIVFCFFAEDVGLLPKRLFRHILTVSERRKEHFERFTRELFVALKDGGYIGFEEVPWFNGGLFVNDAIVDLSEEELHRLRDAAKLDWSTVEPATFGTLFERSLDPGKRQQLGAHYTSPEDIQAILEPVIFKPLRDEWESVKHKADQLLLKREGTKGVRAFASLTKLIDAAVGLFLDRLRSVTVLDPACGSGNFLYLALKGLKNLEGDVIAYTTNTTSLSNSHLYRRSSFSVLRSINTHMS
jgi:restriction-modification enzyme MmeI-like protein